MISAFDMTSLSLLKLVLHSLLAPYCFLLELACENDQRLFYCF